VDKLGAGAEQAGYGERPRLWPEQEEGKKASKTWRRNGVEGACTATFWACCVWID